MRVVTKEEDLKAMLEEAQGEAERAFGNSAVFLERYIGRAKHLEVQVLGDKSNAPICMSVIVLCREGIKKWSKWLHLLVYLLMLLMICAVQVWI